MKKIEAVEVERDHLGYWMHPQVIVAESPMQFKRWLDDNNLECIYYEIEDDCEPDSELYHSYFEVGNPDISKWEATKPEGEGWFVGCYGENEDGACCWWLREKPKG